MALLRSFERRAAIALPVVALLVIGAELRRLQAQTAPDPAAAPAPGQVEVDEDAVATALERALVQQGALLLPPGVVQLQPSLSYIRREADAPAFLVPDLERVAADEIRRDDLVAALTARLGLPFDSQLALSIPLSVRKH